MQKGKLNFKQRNLNILIETWVAKKTSNLTKLCGPVVLFTFAFGQLLNCNKNTN